MCLPATPKQAVHECIKLVKPVQWKRQFGLQHWYETSETCKDMKAEQPQNIPGIKREKITSWPKSPHRMLLLWLGSVDPR